MILSFQDTVRSAIFGDDIMEALQEIDICILESKHVAREVSNASTQIFNYLKRKIETTGDDELRNGFIGKEGQFKTTLFDKELHIRWMVIKTNKEKAKTLRLPPFAFDENSSTIYANMVDIGDGVDFLSIVEGLQHELAHLYEKYRRKVPYSNKDWYETANKNIRSRENEVKLAVAQIIYISANYEKTAFANGAYAYLMNSNDYSKNFDNAIQDTQLFKWLYGLKHDLNMISSIEPNDEFLIQALSEYKNLNLQKLLLLANKTVKNLANAIGKIKVKAIEDYEAKYGNHTIHEHKTYQECLKGEKELYLYYGLPLPKELENL